LRNLHEHLMDPDLKTRIMNAVDARFDEQVAFLAALTAEPSTRGNEQSAQSVMETAMVERGYTTDRWQIDIEEISHLPGFSPVPGPYEDAVNVVGTHVSRTQAGRSLILNGHIDVVPVGPLDMWHTAPFDPVIKDGWMHGRGAGDMKAGLSANIYALDALRSLGVVPAANVHVQSVVEEECTGNGALACLQRGYTADAVLIPEPFDEVLTSAQVGVLWFQVHLKGVPVHVAHASAGANAIEAATPIIAALHEMEARWNARDCRHAEYAGHSHALNFNVGKIAGGDWASSVPAWCTLDLRMGLFPGQDMTAAKEEIEAVIADAARSQPFLKSNPPKVVYNGFHAEGYALADDKSSKAWAAIQTLEAAHETTVGTRLERRPTTATTDARFFGLYADTPALVYGPKAEAIHGFNERVNLETVRRVTQTTALFVADWCGLETLQ
jgi:acetylornithine deacetylase